MSTNEKEIEDELAAAEEMATEGQADESESFQEDHIEDLTDAFAEFDSDFAPAPKPKKVEKKTEAIEEEEVEEEEVEEEEVEEVEEEVESEPSTEEEPSQAELVAMLAEMRAEIQALRGTKPAEGETKETSETKAGSGISREEARKAAHGQLVEQYQLTQDDADKMLTEPEAVLPKVAANLHLSVVESTANLVRAMIPQMLQEHLSRTAEESSFKSSVAKIDKTLVSKGFDLDKARKAVLLMHPNLKGEALAQMVARVAKTLNTETKPEPKAKPAKAKPRTPGAAKAGSKVPVKEKPKTDFELFASEDINEMM